MCEWQHIVMQLIYKSDISRALAPSCCRHLCSFHLTHLGLSFEIDLTAISCSLSLISVCVHIALTWVLIFTLFSMELQKS